MNSHCAAKPNARKLLDQLEMIKIPAEPARPCRFHLLERPYFDMHSDRFQSPALGFRLYGWLVKERILRLTNQIGERLLFKIQTLSEFLINPQLSDLLASTQDLKTDCHFPSFKNLIARSSTSSLFSRIPAIVGFTSMCGTKPIR